MFDYLPVFDSAHVEHIALHLLTGGHFALAVPSVARIREIKDWVETREGVTGVRVEILHDILYMRRSYDEQVRKNIELPLKISA